MSLISQMSFQNPWWAKRESVHEDQSIRKAMASKPPFIVGQPQGSALIIGPRQVGKTTFLKTSIMKVLEGVSDPRSVFFFSCEPLNGKEELVRLLNEYRSYVSPSAGHIYLDEVTFVQGWNEALLHLFNAGYLKDTVVYVTGSSSASLYSETLPGRPIRKLSFYPLNFRMYYRIFHGGVLGVGTAAITDPEQVYAETLKLVPYLSELNRALLEYVQRGGFLAAGYASGDPLNSLYETHRDALLSDLLKLGRDERLFKEIMKYIVTAYGTRVSENSIASSTSVGSHNTVASYIDLAEKLFIVRAFRKFEGGAARERSPKKVYMIDPFIYRVLKRYTTGDGSIGKDDMPAVIEGIVGEHLAREHRNTGYTFFKNGKEVDFVAGNIGIEVKWGSARPEDLKFERGFTLGMDEYKDGDRKRVIPVSAFLYAISEERVFYDL